MPTWFEEENGFRGPQIFGWTRLKNRCEGKMNKYALFLFVMFILSAAGHARLEQEKPGKFPLLKGPYLDQKPPGIVPELFAPGIISLPDYFEHSAAVFSPDGNYLFFMTREGIYWLRSSIIQDLKPAAFH